MKHSPLISAALGLLVLYFITGCVSHDPGATKIAVEIASPARDGSGEPNLFAGRGHRVVMSWVEPEDTTRRALRFATRDHTGWSQPLTIAHGDDWFLNWADFPSVVESDDGTLTAHWLQKSGEATHAYGIRISRSHDGGHTWTRPVSPHPLDSTSEHGFVAMTPLVGRRVLVAWLDGRQTADSQPAVMTLRGAVLEGDAEWSHEALVDDRVCDCCQNSAAATTVGAIVVYRDRSQTDIRDIGVVRFHEGSWTEPRVLFHDGWQINGCPINGPSTATRGARVCVAWFTMAGGLARIKAAFSPDNGETFLNPVTIDDGNPLGRVDTVLLADESALVCWLEVVDDEAEIRLRRIWPDGTMEPSRTIARSSPEHATGFPVMALGQGEVLFAWTNPGDPSTVRTASFALDDDLSR